MRSQSLDSPPIVWALARPTAKSASVFGKQEQARNHRVDLDGQDPAQTHICVSTITTKGKSYRMRKRRPPAPNA
jgi:hypothetical protein